MLKIMICGGHFSPALAVIEELIKNDDYQIYYVGLKKSLEGDKALSLEYLTIRRLEIPFLSITTGRLQRFISLNTLPSLIKTPIGLIQSLLIIQKIKPDIILSFGGFVALPVTLAGWLMNVRIITHEQTSVLGLANRIICKYAKILCLSFKDTKKVSERTKFAVTGNPIRKDFFQIHKSDICNFGNNKLPLIYITGGSQGARSINKILSKIVSKMINKYRIIHQCGEANNQTDYKLLLKVKDNLPLKSQSNYMIFTHVPPNKVAEIMYNSSLIIGRSGANTVTEIGIMNKPAILIPLPWSADNEQFFNALVLEKYGLAKIIKQKDLKEDLLIQTIDSIIKRHSAKSMFIKEGLFKSNAVIRIIEIINTVAKSSS